MRAMVSGTREFEKKKCGGSHRRRRVVRAHARGYPGRGVGGVVTVARTGGRG